MKNTLFYPRSPYAVSKLYFIGLLLIIDALIFIQLMEYFLIHESERRGKTFVPQISVGVSKIVLGIEKHLSVGNFDSKRD